MTSAEQYQLTQTSVLMFNFRTGQIHTGYETVGNAGILQMYKGWTPYYTLAGKYIGFKCGNHYRRPDFSDVDTYWGSNNGDGL